jgi:hypothetical protein
MSNIPVNDKEVFEGNKLIAEFMGYDYKRKFLQSWFEDPILQYHTSWNWLMPVVEKIEDMSYELRKDAAECSLFNFETQHYIVVSGGGIKAIHQLVVEFIKWYNKSKLPKP